jgi:DNA-binding NarL/FixJ family response regulator
MVRSTAQGSGGVILIDGMAGIGKSVLLDEVARVGRDCQCHVSPGRADELDQITPMGALLIGLRAGPRPVLTAGDLRGAETSDQRMWVLDRLQSILEAEAARRPLVITVDDLQWADHATLLAVSSLPQRLFTLPILWVLARRMSPSSPQLETAWRRLSEGGAALLHLGPIDDEAVAAMTADAVGCPPSAELARELGRAGGNPFYLKELLHRLVESGALDLGAGTAQLRRGESPGELTAVAPHLGSLSEGARRLVEIGAVLGQRFPLTLAADLLGRPAGSLVQDVAECRAAHVLEDAGDLLAFRHDLIRQAAYGSLPQPVRVALHRDAARLLAGQGASTLEVAPHLARSARTGDIAAVDALRAAASELIGTNPGAAADLAVRAWELIPAGDARRAEAGAHAVDMMGWAGRLSEAEAVRDQLRLEGGLDPILEATIEVGIHRSWRQSAAGPYPRPVPDRLLADPRLPASFRIFLLAIDEVPVMADDVAKAAGRFNALRAEAEACGEDGPIGVAWLGQLYAQLIQGRLADALEEARQAVAWADRDGGHTRGHVGFHHALALALYALDRLDEAMEAFQVADRVYHRLGASHMIGLNDATRGAALLAAGRLDDAGAAAESARQLGEDFGLGVLVATSTEVLGEVALARGDLAGAGGCANQLAPLLADGHAAPRVAWLPAMLADAEGDPRRALTVLEPAIKSLRRGAFNIVYNNADRFPRLVSICQRAGLAHDAAMISQEAAALVALNPVTPLLAGVAAHCAGLVEHDRDGLADAVCLLRDGQRPLALAAALEDLGDSYARAGAAAAAADALSEAYDISVRCDAQRAAARLRRQMRAVGVVKRAAAVARPAVGWESLTTAEIAVVKLIAAGEPRGAVAERLFLSTNTVNTHLRHAFSKLGVRSSVELARVVLEHDGRLPVVRRVL